MIQFADKTTLGEVRQMWKTCFGDTDEYIDLYFTQKYKDENTLIYIVDDIPVASLQMLPYTITFYGKEISFYYLMGLCTLPEYRERGYMAELINKSHEVMKDRDIPLSILVPAEDWLFGFYKKFGYEQVFEKSSQPIPSLKLLLEKYPDIEDAYSFFKSQYESMDFCVQKNFIDFETIVEEYKMDGCPDKYNLSAMARIINVEYLVSLYAKANDFKSFIFKIDTDRYKVAKGEREKTNAQAALFDIDIKFLCRLLFGYKISELDEKYKALFVEHHPIINLMLE